MVGVIKIFVIYRQNFFSLSPNEWCIIEHLQNHSEYLLQFYDVSTCIHSFKKLESKVANELLLT